MTSTGARALGDVTDRCAAVRRTGLGFARDATYVGIGLTVLGLNRVRVTRRKMTRT